MKKKDIQRKIKANERKIEEFTSLLNRLEIPQEKEKCQQVIIRLQEFQIALIRQAEEDRKNRQSQIIATIVLIIMFTSVVIGFTIGADNEAKRLDSVREQHMIEQQNLK